MIFDKMVIRAYRSSFFSRYDDTGNVFYFSADDFEGLRKERYTFVSSAGNVLRGYFYSYENPIDGRIIIFEHGIGGGHRSYMREIELLCRHGFRVLGYDHTGCMESDGENANGLLQSLSDLNDCICALKSDPDYSGLDISVVGHSWGGYSAANICAFHPDISHIVVISGFVSAEKLADQVFRGIRRLYRKTILNLEKQANPGYYACDAVDALSKTDADVLLVYSSDDRMIDCSVHFSALKNGLKDKPNIRFLLVSGKNHNPNYTEDAVKYLSEFSAELTKRIKENSLVTQEQKDSFKASFDWRRMTSQDENVWNEIFRTLDA